jgi:hypothetical protein
MEPPADRQHYAGSSLTGTRTRTRYYRGFPFPIGNGHLKIENESTMETGFQCAGCGEWNQTTVDESAGRSQSYVEDCQVCCKPNVLAVHYDPHEQEFVITAQLE